MNEKKKYYWIKLKTDFFNETEIDWLLSQSHGCEYVILYQMLCVQTANQNGRLGTQIGDYIEPYSIEKIVRNTKYFCEDIVKEALEYFKKLRLIYLEEEVLQIADYQNIVGKERNSNKKKK